MPHPHIRFLLPFLALVVFLALTTSAHAATYRVRQNGGGDCTTITACLGRLRPGDTLLVGNGTYREQDLTVPSGSSESLRVTVKAENPRGAIILSPGPRGQHETFLPGNYTIIEGFVIDARNASREFSMGDGSHHIRIKNMEIKNAWSQAIAARGSFHELLNLDVHDTGTTQQACYGAVGANSGKNGFCHGIYLSSADTLVDGGSYHHNNGYGMQIYVGTAVRVIVRNVRSHDNFSTGIGNFMPDSKIYNNLVYNNNGKGIWGRSRNALIEYNTVWGNREGDILTDTGAGHTIRNNIASTLVDGNGASLPTGGTSGNSVSNNFVGGNPGFVNAAGADFHLKSGSPAKTASSNGGEVGAYGNGGNPGAGGGGTPTPPPPTGTLCSTVTQSTPIPTGFGSPLNLFTSPVSPSIEAYCTTSTVTARITKPSSIQYHYTYIRGYQWNPTANQWNQFNYQCDGQVIASAWCTGNVTASLTPTTASFIGYTCSYVDTAWKCGCRDRQCTESLWQLQKFQR